MTNIAEFSDIDKSLLKPLHEFEDIQKKQLIDHAVKENILFYVIYINGQPIALHSGDVAKIKNNHPKKIHLSFQHIDGFDYFEGGSFGSEEYNWDSIWIEELKANTLLGLPSCNCVNQTYTTALLQVQQKAIQQFWTNYDPECPPKSEAIKTWLKDNFSIASRMADAIDAIIRPEEFKKGGCKRKKQC